MPRTLRPVRGFGPWGWAMLPVALALSYCICGGFDLRFAVMQWWTDLFGWQSMIYAMIDWSIFPHSMGLWLPLCGAPTLMAVLPAMFLRARTFPRWVWGAAVCALLLNPLI